MLNGRKISLVQFVLVDYLLALAMEPSLSLVWKFFFNLNYLKVTHFLQEKE